MGRMIALPALMVKRWRGLRLTMGGCLDGGLRMTAGDARARLFSSPQAGEDTNTAASSHSGHAYPMGTDVLRFQGESIIVRSGNDLGGRAPIVRIQQGGR
jgi:hypothetical protein